MSRAPRRDRAILPSVTRPREWEEDEVLDRALDAFWAKGFEGTSVHDLTAATGLGRASLYGAFGDKEGLYQRVVEHYLARADAMVACAETAPDDAPTHERLLALLSAWMGPRCTRVAPRGCFLELAGTQGGEPAFAQELLAASLKRREKQLAAMLEEGQARGEVDRARDAGALARMLVLLTQGIASAARAGWTAARLDQALREAIALVAPERHARAHSKNV